MSWTDVNLCADNSGLQRIYPTPLNYPLTFLMALLWGLKLFIHIFQCVLIHIFCTSIHSSQVINFWVMSCELCLLSLWCVLRDELWWLWWAPNLKEDLFYTSVAVDSCRILLNALHSFYRFAVYSLVICMFPLCVEDLPKQCDYS